MYHMKNFFWIKNRQKKARICRKKWSISFKMILNSLKDSFLKMRQSLGYSRIKSVVTSTLLYLGENKRLDPLLAPSNRVEADWYSGGVHQLLSHWSFALFWLKNDRANLLNKVIMRDALAFSIESMGMEVEWVEIIEDLDLEYSLRCKVSRNTAK